MANFTQTVTNSIQLFGCSPPTVWGNSTLLVMTWGSTNWGEGSHSMIRDMEHVILDDVEMSGAVLGFESDKTWSESLSTIEDLSSEGLQTQNGYSYVFVKPTTEAEDRNLSSYSSSSSGSDSYTSLTVAVTSWS